MSRPSRLVRLLSPFTRPVKFTLGVVARVLAALRLEVYVAATGLFLICFVLYRVIGLDAALLFGGGVLLLDAQTAASPPKPPAES